MTSPANDAPASARTPPAVKLDARFDRDAVPAAGGSAWLLVRLSAASDAERAGADAGEGDCAAAGEGASEGAGGTGERRGPLNLAAVLDRSGSMAGAKIDHTRRAVKLLARQLDRRDHLALVTFDDQVAVVHRGTIAIKDAFDHQVDRIQAGGTTNLSGGMFQGFAELGAAREQMLRAAGAVDAAGACVPRMNRVVLLTDGLANVGLTDPAQLAARVARLREEGCTLSALGVGADFDEDLLAGLARAGGGNFYYVADAESIPGIFAHELEGLQAVVGQGLRVRVAPGPGATIADALGYPCQAVGDAVEFDVPDIYRGEDKLLAVRLRIEPAPGSEPAVTEAAEPGAAHSVWVRVELAYEEIGREGGTVRIRLDARLPLTADPTESECAPRPADLAEVERLRLAEAYEEAIRQADAGDHGAAEATLREASRSAYRVAEAATAASGADMATGVPDRAGPRDTVQALRDHAARLEALADQVRDSGSTMAAEAVPAPGEGFVAAESPAGGGYGRGGTLRKELRRLAEQSRRGREQR